MHITVNAKKELGLSLQQVKAAQWFKDLPKELQDEAISQQKACFTPPDAMENTLLNLCLGPDFPEWVDLCAKHYPWADPIKGGPDVNITKRDFLKHKFIADPTRLSQFRGVHD